MVGTTLYDIPSKPPAKSWSLNPWKTRLALNYKGIEYKTDWVEYPDLVTTFKALGLPPNDPNDPGYFVDYTSPALRFDDGKVYMDSWTIIHEIEKRYPTPSLHLHEPIVEQIRLHIVKLAKPLSPNVIPKVSRNLLAEPSKEYFERTRHQRFGMSLSNYEKEKGGDGPWEEVKEPAEQVADLLRKNGGPFFLGPQVSYADFIFVGFLHFLKRVDSSLFDRFVSLDPTFTRVYDASREWLEKDD